MNKTALYDYHESVGSTIVNFHNWLLPVQYKSIVQEHLHTRTEVSIFDISHMGTLIIKDKDAAAFLNKVTVTDVTKLKIGQAKYSLLLNEQGGVIDDIVIYKIGELEYQLCVNASNIEKDFNWLKKHQHHFTNVELKNISSNVSLIAIQGPQSASVMQQILNDNDVNNLKYYHFKKDKFIDDYSLIARMGYTGEDGFEWFLPHSEAVIIWHKLLTISNVKPAGLGARDILRLEMGFCLYGNDITDDITPLEANLNWTINWQKEDFIGKAALLKQKNDTSITKKLVAFKSTDRGIPRKDNIIFNAQKEKIGQVCSGGYSSLLKASIGLAYITINESELNNTILIEVRENVFINAIITSLPFYKK